MILTICNEKEQELATVIVEVLPRIGETICFILPSGSAYRRQVIAVVHQYQYWQDEESKRITSGAPPREHLNHRYYAIV